MISFTNKQLANVSGMDSVQVRVHAQSVQYVGCTRACVVVHERVHVQACESTRRVDPHGTTRTG